MDSAKRYRVDIEKLQKAVAKDGAAKQENNQAKGSQDSGLSRSILDSWRSVNLRSAFFIELETSRSVGQHYHTWTASLVVFE